MSQAFTTELTKVHGSISEIFQLLSLWSPGLSPLEFQKQAISQGILGRDSSDRVTQIVTRGFNRRLLKEGDLAARSLKYLQDRRAPLRLQQALLFHFTLRSSTLLQQSLIEVIHGRRSKGFETVTRDQVIQFFEERGGSAWLPKPWTPTMQLKTARAVLQTLAEFGVLEDRSALERRILPYRLPSAITGYLVHENRERGRAPNSLMELPDWSWYGIAPDRIFSEIALASDTGAYVAQFSGDLLSISFQRKNLEEYLDAVARG